MSIEHQPLVSVVIAVYNRERFIQEAVESVLEQSYTSRELIVVDDGSTDGTVDVVKSYGDRICLVQSENRGPGPARNLGVRHARGELIAFLDSDDRWNTEHLETMVTRLLGDDEAGLVYSAKTWIDAESRMVDRPASGPNPEGWLFDKLLEHNYVSSSSCVLIRRTVFEQLGGFAEAPPLRISEDYHLWLRLAAQWKVLSSHAATVRYRSHGENINLNVVARAQGHIRVATEGIRLIDGDGVDPRNVVDRRQAARRLVRAHVFMISALYCEGRYGDMVRALWGPHRAALRSVRVYPLVVKAALKAFLHLPSRSPDVS